MKRNNTRLIENWQVVSLFYCSVARYLQTED